jgi:hypothetical protein
MAVRIFIGQRQAINIRCWQSNAIEITPNAVSRAMNVFEHGSHTQSCRNVSSEVCFKDVTNFTATVGMYISYIYLYIYLIVCVYIYMCVCVCVFVCVYVRVYITVCVCMYIQYVFICVFSHVDIYVSLLCLSMYVRSFLLYRCPHLAILSASLHKISKQQPH